MPAAVVTGSGGLVGSAVTRRLIEDGFDVIGIDNDARSSFFGAQASTRAVSEGLDSDNDAFHWAEVDIRDRDGIEHAFREARGPIELIVHAAAQPSHDWAASDPEADFTINANGTLNMLEVARAHALDATFAHLSTNKVYGDAPNHLPLLETDSRLELPREHRWFDGIDTSMSIDRTLHSLFGVSKAAADLLVQEYGRYFGMPTVCFRGGCLTGPAHAGAELHGFLSYLMRCAVAGTAYTVYGYGGKQVRDNLHADDVASAVMAFHASPQTAAVYNLGGGRQSNCSVLEAIKACESLTGREMRYRIEPQARIGDHRWWITDIGEFQRDYPDWSPVYGIDEILRELYEQLEAAPA